MRMLSDANDVDQTLTKLILTKNRIGDAGTQQLTEALRANQVRVE